MNERLIPGLDMSWIDSLPIDWSIPVSRYIKRCIAHLEESTVVGYNKSLKPMIRWFIDRGISLEEFSTEHMDEYLSYRRTVICRATGRPISDTTRRSETLVMKIFLRYARREGFLKKNPLSDYDLPKASRPVKVYPHAEEVAQLLGRIPDYYNPAHNANARFLDEHRRRFLAVRNQAIIALLIETGGRITETLTLKLEDYDKKHGTITFPDTKGDDPRTLPVDSVLLQYLAPWLAIRRRMDTDLDYLFCTEQGGLISSGPFSKLFTRLRKFAGLERRITSHAMRRYNVTSHSHVNPEHARRYAGHKDMKTTQGYTGNDPEQMRKTHELAAPLRSVSGKQVSKPRKRAY